MPFESDEEDIKPKMTAGKVSSQKSIFENIPKKPTQKEFEATVKQVEETKATHKQKAAGLSLNYRKLIEDRTLLQNKHILAKDIEIETISEMLKLSQEVEDDMDEPAGVGSLMWISLLLKLTLYQRDRLNSLEYGLTQVDKKCEAILQQLNSLDKATEKA